MPTLFDLFNKKGVVLYQNESLDLDHYYQEPYQDNDQSSDTYDMADPFETDKEKKKRKIEISNEDDRIGNFSFFYGWVTAHLQNRRYRLIRQANLSGCCCTGKSRKYTQIGKEYS